MEWAVDLRLIGVEPDASTIASAAGLPSESDIMMLEFAVEKMKEMKVN
jgi:hypothetical protein